MGAVVEIWLESLISIFLWDSRIVQWLSTFQQNMTSVGCNLINETVKKKKYRKR